MEIRHILKNRRLEIGLTMQEVAAAVGVSEATVSRWESGNIANMGRSKIAALAKVLQVSPSVIMGWEELPDNCTPYNPTHRIPILGRISAGLPLYADEHIEGYTYTDLNGSGEYFALRVGGDSMNAANIHEGNILIVRKQNTVENGNVAVVLVDGQDATVKRFYQAGKTVTLMPQSTNSEHTPQIYDIEKTDITVLGKVVESKILFE